MLLAVIDGAGNGFKANKVADFVKDTVERNYRSGLTTIMKRCHNNLREAFDISSYASCVMSLLLLKPRSLEYAGVGDTSIRVIQTPIKINLFNQGGMVGDIRLSLETPGRLSIRGDERRTKQVIMNLVGNAVKFTDSGKVEIKAARGDGVVEVSVRDTGIGIAREDMKALSMPSAGYGLKGCR